MKRNPSGFLFLPSAKSVDALMRGCVDAMQVSPAATIPVLFSAPLKGELSGTQ